MHVLYVENDPEEARRTMSALRAVALGSVKVTRVATLQVALDILTVARVDVVLLNPDLADADAGLDALQRVLAHAPDVPVVVLTGMDGSGRANEAVEAGAQDYVLKRSSGDGPALLRALEFASRRGARVAALRASNDELGDFAHTVAHDLRGPLAIIMGMAEVLASDAPLASEDRAMFARRIQASTHRLSRFVTGLLAFAEHAEGPAEEVDLGRVADWAVGLVADEVTEAGGLVSIGELPTVRSNEPALRTIFLNLLSTALDRRSPRRPLHLAIEAEAEPDRVLLTVTDNGLSIAAADRVRALLPGETLEATAEADGTGLGLSTVHRLVRQLGGAVWIADGPDGVGSRLRVALPNGTAAGPGRETERTRQDVAEQRDEAEQPMATMYSFPSGRPAAGD